MKITGATTYINSGSLGDEFYTSLRITLNEIPKGYWADEVILCLPRNTYHKVGGDEFIRKLASLINKGLAK